MKNNWKSRTSGFAVISAALLIISALFIGCSEENSLLTTQMDTEATSDAVLTLSSAILSDDGGMLDQLEDLVTLSGSNGMPSVPDAQSAEGKTRIISREYDSISGWWTTVVSKERGAPGGLFYSSYERIYRHQFINKYGNFQKHFISVSGSSQDTAYKVNHEILDGSGITVRPKITHRLLSLGVKWNATGINTDTVIINTLPGFPLTRVASDTVKRGNSIRTLNSELVLNLVDLKGMKGGGLKYKNKISGTVSGTYHATVTFLRGNVYREKEINRTINIVLGGEKIVLKIGNDTFFLDPVLGVMTK